MKNKKNNSLIAVISFFLILGFSFTIVIEDSYSLRDADRDHDGIQDDVDECPLIAETFNKFDDEDGCPDTVIEEKTKYEFPDTDGDGIIDRLDNCVNLPETFNDYLDDDGCPERMGSGIGDEDDSDSDSIPDSVDACPYDKETINQFKDGDGCPDSSDSEFSNIPQENITEENQCLDGKIPVIRTNSIDPVCVYSDVAERWNELGIATILAFESQNVSPPIEPEILEPPQTDSLSEEILPSTGVDNLPLEHETPEIISEVILDTGMTILGKQISYPIGTPHITSKIITIPVGSETGFHTHEYPLFAYVLEGEVTVDYQNEGLKTFFEGDAIMEAIDFSHNGKNTGDVSTKILVVMLGEKNNKD